METKCEEFPAAGLFLVYSGTVGYVGKIKEVNSDNMILKEALRFVEMSVPTGQGTYGKVQSLTPIIGNYNRFPDVRVKYDSMVELLPEMELFKYYEEVHAGVSGIVIAKSKLILK